MDWTSFVHIIESFVRVYWKEVLILLFGGSGTIVLAELLKRHFAKKDQKEQQRREREQRMKSVKRQFKRCIEKVITDWEEPIKSESLEKEMNVRRKKLHDNGIKLKEVVADYEEYLPKDIVKEALDIAREIKEISALNVLVHIVNKPNDEQPDVIFKERGDKVVERAKELIKRL
jgi:hypothetical protein